MLAVLALTTAFAQTGTAVIMTQSGALDGYESVERAQSCGRSFVHTAARHRSR